MKEGLPTTGRSPAVARIRIYPKRGELGVEMPIVFNTLVPSFHRLPNLRDYATARVPGQALSGCQIYEVV